MTLENVAVAEGTSRNSSLSYLELGLHSKVAKTTVNTGNLGQQDLPEPADWLGGSLDVKEEVKFESAPFHAACAPSRLGGHNKAETETPRCHASSPLISNSGGTKMRVSAPLDTGGPATGS